MSDAGKLVRSNQEQAVAAWVDYLNQLRLTNLLDALSLNEENLHDAIASVDEALRRIDLEVVGSNRGGLKGMHGFIAEVAEVGVGNARSQILGTGSPYEWVNNNGPADLLRDSVEIQQKFVAAGGNFSLGAVAEHLEKYPDFVRNGGKYQIPKDFFEVVHKLYAMSPAEASKELTRGGDGSSFRQWAQVHELFDQGRVPIESLEPSHLEYREVQRGTYHSTLETEKQCIGSTKRAMDHEAYAASAPSVHEAAMVTVESAAIQGGTTFVMAVVQRRREGKKLNQFTDDDWIEIAGDTGASVVKGGIRGLSIYALTNFTATPAAVASALVTAAFGIAEQANKFRSGEIDELRFIENSEIVALEVTVSALSSFIGQALIPVPVLGAVIGNTAGTVLYKVAASSLSKREQELVAGYIEEQRLLDEQLTLEYQELIEQFEAGMADYLDVLDRAFSPDVAVALDGSVHLALALGVASQEVLDSDEKVRTYFLD